MLKNVIFWPICTFTAYSDLSEPYRKQVVNKVLTM